MKSIVVPYIVLLSLLTACTPLAEPTIQQTQTPSPAVTSMPAVRPTSTIDELQQASGGIAFCQVAPRKAPLGSSVNLSAYRLPPNHPISIFIYYGPNEYIQVASDTITTDNNGYVNIDLQVPAELPTENWSRIGLLAQGPLGPVAEASCGIWPWTESSLATYTAWQATLQAPTLTPPPEQAAVTATQQALHDRFDQYCIYGHQARGFRFSPNGQWVEVFCSSDTLVIVRVDETQHWEVSSDTLINPSTDYFAGVSHWSNDGAFAYITFDPHTDGYWEPYHHGVVLYRLDLESGQISETLPLGKSDWIFYAFAFSPNDRRLAYIVTDRSPVILNIRDMQTGEEESFELDPGYNTGGAFAWSPDNEKLVFSISRHPGGDELITSILLWDRETSKIAELVTDYPGGLRANEWIAETMITLDAIVLDQGQIKTLKYELDLTDNRLIELNP